MVISKASLKKELKALGLKTYKKKGGKESFVRKGDIKKVLANLEK